MNLHFITGTSWFSGSLRICGGLLVALVLAFSVQAGESAYRDPEEIRLVESLRQLKMTLRELNLAAQRVAAMDRSNPAVGAELVRRRQKIQDLQEQQAGVRAEIGRTQLELEEHRDAAQKEDLIIPESSVQEARQRTQRTMDEAVALLQAEEKRETGNEIKPEEQAKAAEAHKNILEKSAALDRELARRKGMSPTIEPADEEGGLLPLLLGVTGVLAVAGGALVFLKKRKSKSE